MLKGTDISSETFDELSMKFARQGLDGHSAAIDHLGLTKTPWHLEDEVPYADTAGTLEALRQKDYKLGIIANQNGGTEQRLKNWGLRHYFDVIAASAEVGYTKPNKEIFERAFELAHCSAQDSIMVGDRLDNDMIPAKKLGMKTIWIKNDLARFQDDALGKGVADHQINVLAELKNIL